MIEYLTKFINGTLTVGQLIGFSILLVFCIKFVGDIFNSSVAWKLDKIIKILKTNLDDED